LRFWTIDLEWKLTYVGSAESAAHDQILDTVVVGPVPVGKHKFVFQADQPDPEKIPVADAIGVTAVLLTCSYKEHEFVRVGYFVNNDYIDPELKDNPPPVPQYDKVTFICDNVFLFSHLLMGHFYQMTRNILEEPRVTRFKIDWGGEVCEATNEMEMETQVEMRENAESSLMEPPLKSYIHSESSHSTMEVV
jgi:histone chaperone ASF1